MEYAGSIAKRKQTTITLTEALMQFKLNTIIRATYFH